MKNNNPYLTTIYQAIFKMHYEPPSLWSDRKRGETERERGFNVCEGY